MHALQRKYIQEDSDLLRLFPGAGPGDHCLLKHSSSGGWIPILYAESEISLEDGSDDYVVLVVLPQLKPTLSPAILESP